MGVGFTQEGAKRIADATIIVERDTRNDRGRRPRTATASSLGFWAKITQGSGAKYSWEALKPTDNDELTEDTDWGEGSHTDGTGYAVEAVHQSEHVLEDSVVWLVPAKNEDYYLFDYHPGIQPAKLSAGSSIDKRSGSTPGSADVTIEDFDGTSFTDGQTVKAYNPFRSEIEGDGTNDLYLELAYGDGGVWWVVAVDCEQSDDGTSQ